MNTAEAPAVIRPEIDIVTEKREVAAEMGRLVSISGAMGYVGIAEEYRERYATLRERHEALEKELFRSYTKPRLEAEAEAARLRNEERWAREAARVAALPVKERKNGWEIVNDGGVYHVRDPHTKESVYSGKLRRCREVAAESPPDPPAVPPPA